MNNSVNRLAIVSVIQFIYISTIILSGCVHDMRMYQADISTQSALPSAIESEGNIIPLQEYAWLYLPKNSVQSNQKKIKLTFHFHTDVSYAIREHNERNVNNPLIIFNSGSGSRAYKVPFENTTLFSQLLRQVLIECINAGAAKSIAVSEIELSSFSAGYGAVREILKSPAYVRQISTVILADSMYASYADQEKGIPVQEHIQPFVDFAQLARHGEKTFLISYSQVVPGSYASTAECAHAIVKQVGGKVTKINPPHSTPEEQASTYPMIEYYNQKGLHVWGYEGNDANAHVAHVHSLAEMWLSIPNQ